MKPFGREVTAEDCEARAAWERSRIPEMLAAGWPMLAEAHERTALAYEQRATELRNGGK